MSYVPHWARMRAARLERSVSPHPSAEGRAPATPHLVDGVERVLPEAHPCGGQRGRAGRVGCPRHLGVEGAHGEHGAPCVHGQKQGAEVIVVVGGAGRPRARSRSAMGARQRCRIGFSSGTRPLRTEPTASSTFPQRRRCASLPLWRTSPAEAASALSCRAPHAAAVVGRPKERCPERIVAAVLVLVPVLVPSPVLLPTPFLVLAISGLT